MSIFRYLLINEKQDENLPVASSYACCMLSVDRNDLALKYMTGISKLAFFDFSLKLGCRVNIMWYIIKYTVIKHNLATVKGVAYHKQMNAKQ